MYRHNPDTIGRNTGVEKRELNEDRSQNDLRPEAASSVYRFPQSVDSDLDEAPSMVTGVQDEIF